MVSKVRATTKKTEKNALLADFLRQTHGKGTELASEGGGRWLKTGKPCHSNCIPRPVGSRMGQGNGVAGALPVMDAVKRKAEKRGVDLIILPTPQAIERMDKESTDDTNAILHVTC